MAESSVTVKWSQLSFTLWTTLFIIPLFTTAFIIEKDAVASDVECYGPNMQHIPSKGLCECVHGTVGDPDFFCSRNLTHYCTVKDPHMLQSFEGHSYFYDYPCVQTIAEIHMHYNQEETLDVYLSASIDRTGTLVLDGMGVNRSNNSLFVTYGQVFSNGEPVDFHTVEERWNNRVVRVDPHTWIISLPDVTVMLRPFNPHRTDTKPSGLQVAYNKDSHYHVHEVYELCSHVMGEFEDAVSNMGYKYSEIYALKVSLEAHSDEQTTKLSKLKNDMSAKCDDVKTAFAQCVAKEQTATVNFCGPIMTNSLIRLCLTTSGFDVMVMFASCIRAYCLSDYASCQTLQQPGVHDCYKGLGICQDAFEVHERIMN